MRRAVPIFVLLSAMATLALAADANVSGKWKLTSTTPRGERTSEVTLAQDGEKLTVTQKDRDGNDFTSEGTVKAGEITWTTKRQTPMGEWVITYKGKVEGKTMSGTSERVGGDAGPGGPGGGGPRTWKAEKIEQ